MQRRGWGGALRSEIILGQLLLYTHGLGGKIVASNYYQTISTVGLMFSFFKACAELKNAMQLNLTIQLLFLLCPGYARQMIFSVILSPSGNAKILPDVTDLFTGWCFTGELVAPGVSFLSVLELVEI